jgi:hypothetical protein
VWSRPQRDTDTGGAGLRPGGRLPPFTLQKKSGLIYFLLDFLDTPFISDYTTITIVLVRILPRFGAAVANSAKKR